MNEAPRPGRSERCTSGGSAWLCRGGSPPLTAGVTIFTGRFGSGKTETAINYALAMVKDPTQGIPGQASHASQPSYLQPQRLPGVLLIDLDIVTPYFRTREVAGAMQGMGVSVIAPALEGQHLDVPAISPEILGAIQQLDLPVILDVGGDRQGARALGQFSAAISRHGHGRGVRMHFVVNPFRPFTDTLDGLAGSIAEIEASSRLQVTNLISNPNLMGETTAESIIGGHAQIKEFGRVLGLPVAFLCVERCWSTRLGTRDQMNPWLSNLGEPVLILDRHFAMPWE